MLEYFEKKTNIENPNLIKFKWRKNKLEKDKAKKPETGKVNFFAKYRDGGEGFIAWCEEHVNLAIYKEGATVPTWMPMSELPDTPNPDTGRSYKQMWESQKEIVREALRMENGRFVYRLIVLCWQRGDGKCLDLLTKVLMFDGTIKYAKDVKIGDQLMGDDNKPRNVLKLVHGNEELFEVVPNRGESFTVTGDHKLTLKKRAITRNRSGEAKRDAGDGEIIDITVNDFMKKSDHFKKSHMLFRVPINWPEQEVPIDPYFLGVWLGDGSSNAPEITTMDHEVVDYLHSFAESNGLHVSVKEKVTMENNEFSYNKAKTYRLIGEGGGRENHLLNSLRENNLINNKHIPQVYKSNSREVRMQILAGILDADGCRNRNSFEITLKREGLSQDVAFIARSLGFHAEVKKVTKGIKSTGFVGEYWRVGISGDCSQIPVKIERRRCEKRSDWKDVLVSNIKEIKSVGDKDYIGFMVDGNNRFLLGDFTVTHNSLLACLFQLWKFFCFPKQQIMLGANSKDQVKFVHYDIMKEIILNSPKLVKIIGRKNLQEKEMRLVDNQKRVISIVRSISSFSGIVSNITGYTFSEIFDMKNPKFFVQLDGSIRNIPNAMGVIDSTISEKTHILYQLYQNSLEDTNSSVYFSYRCSPKGIHEDFMNPQMTQRQLDEYKRKFPPAEFARYFKNTWDTGVKKVFTDAQLEAMHYIGLKGVSLQDPMCQMNIIKMLEEKNDKKTELEQKNKEAVLGPEFQNYLKQISDAVIHMSDVFTLDSNDYFCEMATKRELDRLEDIYDTYWCVGIGIDRADPLKNKVDYFEEQDKTKRKRTTGARTMMVYIAKGLIGSRSNPMAYMDVDAVHKYIYVILSVKHCNTSTIEEMKNEINSAETEYGDIDAICSERWGMFDIVTWCDEKNIPLELISPTTDKQKEAFGELYLAVANGRVKVPHIGYYGTRKKDILMEEMEILESDSDKIWYGSPEKNKSDGIQDDTCFALVWGIYGLRFKTVDDMKPRTTTTFMGQFIPNANLHGNY